MAVCKPLNITVSATSTPSFTTGHCRCLVTFSTPNPCMKKTLVYVELSYVGFTLWAQSCFDSQLRITVFWADYSCLLPEFSGKLTHSYIALFYFIPALTALYTTCLIHPFVQALLSGGCVRSNNRTHSYSVDSPESSSGLVSRPTIFGRQPAIEPWTFQLVDDLHHLLSYSNPKWSVITF